MSLSAEEVRKIAKLSRLALSNEEVALYQAQLLKILDSMAELSALDTSQVPPTSSVLVASEPLREDEVRPFPDPEKILGLAPAHEGRYFKVKKVIES